MKEYKGTPHPKKRKPLDVITNKQDAAASAKKTAIAANKNSSPLKRLHVVHSSVARLLEKIDSLVTGIHKKKLSEKLSAEEINNFSRAMTTVEGTLQEWHTYFLQVARRPSETAVESRRYCQDFHNNDLIPMLPTAEKSLRGSLSDSPLVSAARDESRKVLHFTPQFSMSASKGKQRSPPLSSMKKAQTPSTTNSKKVTFASTPQTITPSVPSPPHSVRLRRPSMSSSSSCLSTPSFLLRPAESPPSVELATPQAPPEMVNKYPKWFPKSNGAKQWGKSPGATGLSPTHSPTGLRSTMSPFKTPGLVLRSPSQGESPVSDPGSADITSKLANVNL